MISSRFFEKLPCDHSELGQGGRACTVDGSALRIFSRVKIREKEFVATPTVAELSDDGIVGVGFCELSTRMGYRSSVC